MERVELGRGGPQVTPLCLGTMTFGEQVDERAAHAILDRALERGLNFIDTAEMYAVPARRETCGATETIIGRWFQARPEVRAQVVLASKVAGPSRGMPWVREGEGLTPQDIARSCEGSLRRLRTEVIDLYQVHWPERHVPIFGARYYEPAKESSTTPLLAQLEALSRLVDEGKVRHIGLSNESPYGVHEFVRLAEQHGLVRVVSVQNPYSLLHRAFEDGLDETCHRLGVALLAYSPLAYGLLTGKYDAAGPDPATPEQGRLARFESTRRQRWGRPRALDAARRYNALAQRHGLTPVQLALGFCRAKWQVRSTILGVTSLAQLDADIDAWQTSLPPELLAEIDAIRQDLHDPAQ